MEDDKFYLDDLPFDYDEVDQKLLQKSIPKDIYLEAQKWGYSDTVVRESLFSFFCKEYFGFESCKAYYESDIAKRYFEDYKSNTLKLDYEKVKDLAKRS